MADGYIIDSNGNLQAVSPVVTVQIRTSSDLSAADMAQLAPGSIAHTPGWKAAWEKKPDGTWESMV